MSVRIRSVVILSGLVDNSLVVLVISRCGVLVERVENLRGAKSALHVVHGHSSIIVVELLVVEIFSLLLNLIGPASFFVAH